MTTPENESNLAQITPEVDRGADDGTADPTLGGPGMAGVNTGASDEELESGAQSSGEPQTGDTRTMTTPGSSQTADGASQGHRIAGEDNRQ